MKKLFKVTIQMMVVATDEEDAKFVAGSVDVDIHACDFEAEEITDIEDCLPGWETALPWGDQGGDELECAELIKRLKRGLT